MWLSEVLSEYVLGNESLRFDQGFPTAALRRHEQRGRRRVLFVRGAKGASESGAGGLQESGRLFVRRSFERGGFTRSQASFPQVYQKLPSRGYQNLGHSPVTIYQTD